MARSIWHGLGSTGLRVDQFPVQIITQRRPCHERTRMWIRPLPHQERGAASITTHKEEITSISQAGLETTDGYYPKREIPYYSIQPFCSIGPIGECRRRRRTNIGHYPGLCQTTVSTHSPQNAAMDIKRVPRLGRLAKKSETHRPRTLPTAEP